MKVIAIIGGIGAGKTTFLTNISTPLRRFWNTDGFCSYATNRPNGPHQSGRQYNIKLLKDSSLYPWGQKKSDGRGFEFNLNTKKIIEDKFSPEKLSQLDVMIIDDLGFLEVSGEGFANFFERCLKCVKGTIIVSVKKAAFDQFKEKFNLKDCTVLDLDDVSGRECKRRLIRELKKQDGEDIGIFATINGMIEVGIGSVLHAVRVPCKGFILVGIQNFFMTLFSKELKGRGLAWIALISAGMKSFSPAGGRLRPMIYIFLQGLIFSLPIMILGHCFLSCLLGSLLLGTASLLFKFLAAFIVYGSSVFEASISLFNQVLWFLHILPQSESLELETVIIVMLVVKLCIASAVCSVAYFFDFSPLLFRWKHKVENIEAENCEIETNNWKQAVVGACKDMTLKRFILPFVFMLFVIYFFTNLTTSGFIAIVLRALIISWIAFVLSRRMDFAALIKFLKNKDLKHIADAMEKAVKTIQTFRKK